MPETIMYNGAAYQTDGDERIGQHFQLCFQPLMSGPIVGWREVNETRYYLVQITVPYGSQSDVHSVVHEYLINKQR